MTTAEADALVLAILGNHRYEKESQEQQKRIEEKLKDKLLQKQCKRDFLRMIGLYAPFSSPFWEDQPQYEFAVILPGEVIETNGTRIKAGRTRWKFTGAEMFPVGYEMNARSIVIDRDGQKKALGRVVIDDETKALDFMETAGEKGPLLEAVRKLHQTGDRNALRQVEGRTYEESQRAKKLRKMLLNE